MCDYEPSTKNNNRYIKLHNNIVPISQIYSIYTIDNNVYFESEEETFQFTLPAIEINSDIITTFVNDIMNNMHDDFALSSMHDILCRKIFIYLTCKMCEEYGSIYNSQTLIYLDSDLDCLISDCGTIFCRIEFSKKTIKEAVVGDQYYLWTKHSDEKMIKFENMGDKLKFVSMYEDWIVLKDIVDNFEIYD